MTLKVLIAAILVITGLVLFVFALFNVPILALDATVKGILAIAAFIGAMAVMQLP